MTAQVPMFVGCQEIYKVSTYINGTGLYNKTDQQQKPPLVYSYKCLPRLNNRFCGTAIDDKKHWHLYQSCVWHANDIIECPLYRSVYKDYWEFNDWNTETLIIQARGFSQQLQKVFTTDKLTVTPTLVCENFDKINRNDTMFQQKRVVVQGLGI